MLAPAELDDRHLGALAVADHRGEHLAALQQRLSESNIGTLAHQQHFAKLDRGAWLGIEPFDAQNAILGHPILFSARGDDCVHRKRRRNGLRRRPRILLADPGWVKRLFLQAPPVLSPSVESFLAPVSVPSAPFSAQPVSATMLGPDSSARTDDSRRPMTLEEIRALVRTDLLSVDQVIRARLKSAVPLVDQVAEH